MSSHILNISISKLPPRITQDESEHLLKRRPDLITPNGLNVHKFRLTSYSRHFLLAFMSVPTKVPNFLYYAENFLQEFRTTKILEFRKIQRFLEGK